MDSAFSFEKINTKENPIEDFDVSFICEKAESIIKQENELGVGKSADVYLESFKKGDLA